MTELIETEKTPTMMDRLRQAILHRAMNQFTELTDTKRDIMEFCMK